MMNLRAGAIFINRLEFGECERQQRAYRREYENFILSIEQHADTCTCKFLILKQRLTDGMHRMAR